MIHIYKHRVLQARERWELERVDHGHAYEDSWVGSKLAGYLRSAGYEDVQERTYRIIRSAPIPMDFRLYLQGIAEWFVCEGAPHLSSEDVTNWLQCFLHETQNALDQESFLARKLNMLFQGYGTNLYPKDSIILTPIPSYPRQKSRCWLLIWCNRDL